MIELYKRLCKNIIWEKMSNPAKSDPPSYFEATGIPGFQTTNYETNWNTDYGPGPSQENGQDLGNGGSLVVKSEPTSYSDSSTSSKTSIDNQSDSLSITSTLNSSSIISDPSASSTSSSSSDSSTVSIDSINLCSCLCPCCTCLCC